MSKFIVMLCLAVVVNFMNIVPAKAEDVDIIVDISQQTMYVETPTDYYEWPVSTARKGYYTPRGVFQPYYLAAMHYSKKYDNAPMPNSIFFHGGYAIHATEAINKLGSPASHGCIRLSPQNAQWLFRIVKEYGADNTTIYIQD